MKMQIFVSFIKTGRRVGPQIFADLIVLVEFSEVNAKTSCPVLVGGHNYWRVVGSGRFLNDFVLSISAQSCSACSSSA